MLGSVHYQIKALSTGGICWDGGSENPERKAYRGSVSRVWVNQDPDQGSKVLRSRGSISTKDVKRKSASLAILGKINCYFMV